jgi:hypothetical protein
VAVGRVVVAIDGEHAVDRDSRGISRDQDDRLLPVRILAIRVRLAHDDVQLTPWVARTRGPPFLPSR